MQKKLILVFLGVCFLVSAAAQAAAGPAVLDPAYGLRVLVAPSSLGHGVNGCNFDAGDNLYVGSVSGVATYRVNTDTGKASVFVGAPDGGADDLFFSKDGKMYWTSFFLGKVMVRNADGRVIKLAENLPGANAVTMNKDGRLFISQCFLGDAIWEIDPSGKGNNRIVAGKIGGPNGFMFGPDGYLYVPLWFKGQIVKLDVNTGSYTVVADGIKVPAAVKFDSRGNLYALDTATGEVLRIDAKSGKKTVVASLEPHLDNFALDSRDRMFVTNMNVNGIYQVDVKTGKVRTVTEAKLVFPQGIAVSHGPEGDTLYIADNFAYKKVDALTGKVDVPHNGSSFPNTSSLSADGNYILMSGWFTGKVQVFDKKTDQLLYSVDGFKAVAGTLMLADGSLLVAEGGTGTIFRVADKEGRKRDVVATGLIGPTYMAPAGPNAVYVTEYTAGRISKVDLASGEKKVIFSGLQGPKGMAVRKDGKIIVVESGAKRLLTIDPVLGKSKPLAVNLAIGQPGEVKGGHPAYSFTGVAVSDSGAVYVTSDLENTIYQIYPK